jgi:hypothetical protein
VEMAAMHQDSCFQMWTFKKKEKKCISFMSRHK